MYKRILVAFDESAIARRALREALRFATEDQASLRVVHVVDVMLVTTGEVFFDFEAYRRQCLEAGQHVLDMAAAMAREAGVEVETVLLEVEGSRFSNAIIEEANRSSAELIVLGSHGRGALAHLLLGSVAERVLRHAPVPVLLVRGSEDNAEGNP